jgi:hypothetical protein
MRKLIKEKIQEIQNFNDYLFQTIGPDSQDYLFWKDELNKISMDEDR